MLARADQIGAAHAAQRFSQHRPVVRVVPAQECLVQPAHLQSFRDVHCIAVVRDFAQRVLARVPHRRRGGHRRGQECLHLVGAIAVLLQPQRELEHVLVGRARMRRDEVRDQVLLLARFLREFLEQLLEAVIRADAGLHHLRQRPFADRFRRDLEIAADVMLDQLLDVLGRLDREVVTHARADQHLADSRQRARAPIQFDQRHVVGVEIRADAGIHARRPATCRLDRRRLARESIHVGSRAAEVGDHAGEARHRVAHGLDLVDDRFFRAALDDAALVLGDRAERAAAEAAALDRNREADHLVCRDLRLPVERMRHAPIRQLVDRIHLLGRERQRRRIEPHIDVAMALHERTRVTRIRFQMQDARGVRV